MATNRIFFFLAFVVFVHVAISSVMSSDIPFNYPNGDNYTAPKNFVNCNFLNNPCSADSPYKICIAVWDWFMNGVCFKNEVQLNSDEPVLTVINYATKELNQTLLTRFDIPNDPVQLCEGIEDKTTCKPEYFCLDSKDSNNKIDYYCAKKIY